jgi:HAD superfamily hydrolase (TIGR01509 family)
MIFDLYIFDLDGTIINTEQLHYKAYKNTLLFFNIDIEFNFNIYCKYAHYNDIKMKEFIETFDISYEKFYNKKKEYYLSYLDNDLELIDGIDTLISKLKQENIPICLVTHSDIDIINKLKIKLPLLNLFDKIICKNDYFFKKPNPECYLNALQFFEHIKNPIGFEDSYKGYLSLKNANITSVFIGDYNYYYYHKIKPINMINTYNNFNENKIIITYDKTLSWTTNKINKYINQIQNINFNNIIKNIVPIIINSKNNLYLTGIGKCGHVCKKSISTWQSMGISCQYLNIIDLFHGDFGILKENDIIIYISNSGNTQELLNCAEYINKHFKILQIAITMNSDNLIKKFVNYNFILGNVVEIDNINMAPTSSSVIFMMLLDMIGVYISEQNELSIEKFKLYHPGGDLGKKNSNIIDYIVIVASGSGTRLYPLTKYIPKILVTFDNVPFIEKLINYWKKYCNNIIIIHNSEYKNMINFYISKYDNIKLISFDNITGTADTINKTITNEYYGKNILFTWCDILPDENIDEIFNNNTIFTYGNECRYKIHNNNIILDSKGNIIGIYFIKNYYGIKYYTIGDDICDVFIKNFNNFDEYKINKLIDIGDIHKFNYYNKPLQTRFFNKITFFDKYIIKESINNQGNDIIKKEINWYLNINHFNNIPQFEIINDKIKLEFICGNPVYNVINHQNKQHIINLIYDKLKILHTKTIIVNTNDNINNIIYESYDKIIYRVNLIKPLINLFNINNVNGIHINHTLIEILNHCKNILLLNIDNEYSFIHGDCTFSNILINNNDLFFIDPRGYFGNSLIYGPKEYDYAKIMYSISGYDLFNLNYNFSINIDNGILTFDIPTMFDNLDFIINDKIKAWFIIIWFGLAQYNSNNILKCISSYYNGFYWYYKLFQ